MHIIGLSEKCCCIRGASIIPLIRHTKFMHTKYYLFLKRRPRTTEKKIHKYTVENSYGLFFCHLRGLTDKQASAIEYLLGWKHFEHENKNDSFGYCSYRWKYGEQYFRPEQQKKIPYSTVDQKIRSIFLFHCLFFLAP